MSDQLTDSTLTTKYIRLLKPMFDARGNLYLAKDYSPGELPEYILDKGRISVINEDELNQDFQDFQVVTNTVPEVKVDLQVSNSSKKAAPKKPTVQNLTPTEVIIPTKANS
jgi:hypothetical protein